VTVSLILVVSCLVASVLAWWRHWSPPLAVSLAIGLAARVAIAALLSKYTPPDVARSFYNAGQDVLHGRDPLTSLDRYQWNFLPFSAYLFAAEAKTGLPWQYASKLLPVACDLATIALVGRFVPAEEHRRNAQLLYALCPLAIFISALHGQVEPIAIMLGLSALLLARRQRVLAAGVMGGLAVASKSWPVVFLPGVFLYVPWRRWWLVAAGVVVVVVGWALVIPLALHDSLGRAVPIILGYRSFSGTFGWSGLLRFAHLTGGGYSGPSVNAVQQAGTIVTLLAFAAVLAVFWFRLRRSPADVTVALILTFLITSAGVGPQYLLWPAALLYALRRPAGYAYLLLASAWTGLYYLYAFPRDETGVRWTGVVLEALSIAIVLAAVASMPWKPATAGRAEPRPRSARGGPMVPASRA
jgi:hypothetical protein